jgi:hypothetical protein
MSRTLELNKIEIGVNVLDGLITILDVEKGSFALNTPCDFFKHVQYMNYPEVFKR